MNPPLANELLFRAETRGGKWAIEVRRNDENTSALIWLEFKNGRHCGSGGSINWEYVTKRVAALIKDAAVIDSINYTVKTDSIGVLAELEAVKDLRLYPFNRINSINLTRNLSPV